ncbi:hypothetical protein B5T_03176 [Alloalcanivorax dieselolei B5]|uniref:Transmembrane protein n=1 Tax=Alcanivorax dieselolei (strain DSM 16502 / CGMCC 1.3690 / MCCC 1A00001 / B-5) TaxID=930169 RepID=K0CFK2_ALCDB|nr:hypothetical protein [Alloalcanivorax dieselolei]AFT71443.1 hypothetical protein B5T_03176 [Alloalcanivorax dieselolei B5]GGK11003.1 hypothetical protein GCM10007426_43870 [Alloalcanivorax dieselolei]
MRLVGAFVLTLNLLMVFGLAALSGFWWVWMEGGRDFEIFRPALFLFVLGAYVYEAGYKKKSRKEIGRFYFVVVFLVPALGALLGFLYGVFSE